MSAVYKSARYDCEDSCSTCKICEIEDCVSELEPWLCRLLAYESHRICAWSENVCNGNDGCCADENGSECDR